LELFTQCGPPVLQQKELEENEDIRNKEGRNLTHFAKIEVSVDCCKDCAAHAVTKATSSRIRVSVKTSGDILLNFMRRNKRQNKSNPIRTSSCFYKAMHAPMFRRIDIFKALRGGSGRELGSCLQQRHTKCKNPC
jgi:hypothetical protein